MKNNIKELIKLKDISINELSRLIEKDYATTHALVNRESLESTPLNTLIKVSKVLDVDIQMLYSEVLELSSEVIKICLGKDLLKAIDEVIEDNKFLYGGYTRSYVIEQVLRGYMLLLKCSSCNKAVIIDSQLICPHCKSNKLRYINSSFDLKD